MSSLGFHGGSARAPPRPPRTEQSVYRSEQLPPPSKVSDKSRRPASSQAQPLALPKCPCGATCWLTLLHLLLFGCHLACAIVAVELDIRFPMTVFETRLSEEAVFNFTCIYDHSIDPLTNETFCQDPAYTALNVSADCSSVHADHVASPFNPFMDESSSVNRGAYSLYRFSDDYTPERGVEATRGILFTIALVTALFHLVYAATTLRLAWEASRGGGRTTDFVVESGGLPARWYEYAFTASLMAFFIGNTANVFEFYALLAFALGTFALMYFGLAIEHEAFSGDPTRALVYFYVPGTALFVLTWLPPIRQVFTDIAELSCSDPGSYFGCAKTCFGHENPIGVFVIVLLVLFLVFPLVALYKIFIVGGWETLWTGRTKAIVRQCLMVERAPPMLVAYHLVTTPLICCFFGVFVLYASLLAVWRIVVDTLWPVFPCTARRVKQTPSRPTALRAFFFGEFAYALASGTSKLFLFIYFATVFAQRSW